MSSKYLEMMQKRTKGDLTSAVTRSCQICLDVEQYNSTRVEWEEAKKEAGAARLRHATQKAKAEAGQGPAVKMNADSPVKIAAKEMDAAEKAASKAKAAVQESFIKVTVKGLGKPELVAIRLEVGDDNDEWTREVLKRALVDVRDYKGNVISDITADVLADFMATAPAGDWTRLSETLDEASAGVDFPT